MLSDLTVLVVIGAVVNAAACFITTAGTLKTVQQNLRRLSAPEKVSDSWERP